VNRRGSIPATGLAFSVILALGSLTVAACRPSQTVGRQTKDAAIEAKIKTKLATEVGATTITAVEVNVTNGVVTLAGPVESEDQRQRIASVAGSVEGVASVTNNLQVAVVVPPPPGTTPTKIVTTSSKPIFVPFPTVTAPP